MPSDSAGQADSAFHTATGSVGLCVTTDERHPFASKAIREGGGEERERGTERRRERETYGGREREEGKRDI